MTLPSLPAPRPQHRGTLLSRREGQAAVAQPRALPRLAAGADVDEGAAGQPRRDDRERRTSRRAAEGQRELASEIERAALVKAGRSEVSGCAGACRVAVVADDDGDSDSEPGNAAQEAFPGRAVRKGRLHPRLGWVDVRQ
jgi:hypothetical protein